MKRVHPKHWVVLISSVFLVGAGATPARADIRKLDARARAATAELQGPVPVAKERIESGQIAATASGQLDVFIVGDVSRAELEALGVEVRTKIGDLMTAFVPVEVVEPLAALASVRRVEGSAPVELHLDASVPNTNANQRGGGAGFRRCQRSIGPPRRRRHRD